MRFEKKDPAVYKKIEKKFKQLVKILKKIVQFRSKSTPKTQYRHLKSADLEKQNCLFGVHAAKLGKLCSFFPQTSQKLMKNAKKTKI